MSDNHSDADIPQFSKQDLNSANDAYRWLHAPIPEGVTLVITHKLRKSAGSSPKEIVSEIDYSGVLPQQLLKSGAHPHILVEWARTPAGRKSLDSVPSRASGIRNKIVVKSLLAPSSDDKAEKSLEAAARKVARALASASPEEKAAMRRALGL